MKTLVTGGAGFIGNNIVRKLVEDVAEVRVLDNLSTGKKENLTGVSGEIDFIKGDLTVPEDVDKAVEGVDYVIHEAALPSVPRSLKNPLKTNKVNVEGTLNVLEAARKHEVKRVVYAGSSSAYGDTPTLPKKEEMPENPLSPYAVSKLAGEHYCRAFFNSYGLETVVVRYFNVFGARQNPDSQYSAVIPKFITMMSAGENPSVYGDGTQSRDFTYIDNVVDGTVKACTVKKAAGEVINIACNDRITVNQLVEDLNELMETNLEPKYLEERAGDVKHSQADITKAKKLLDYIPLVGFKDGLRKTVEYYASLE